ncbi:hypothetical protein B0H21DRAFT_710687 [Amylocystis lapponica]|nr:hypothetical protein B0H21DRAFT_710687 [Amylocystis lapponica]
MTKSEALGELDGYRVRMGITDETGALLRNRRSKTRVLGSTTLPLVWDDMREVVLPSSISRAPSKIGATGQGTIGADEWRTFCTINLPITLIYRWGTLPENTREYKILMNFMHLVTAVKLATMRIVTPDRLWQYRISMHRYLTSLLELFPGTTLTPYQHMSLHLPDTLTQLGPAPSIWVFAFERANYILQQTQTNNRIGDSFNFYCSSIHLSFPNVEELAVTLLTRFCCRQNIRALFASASLPAPLHPIVASFFDTFQSDIRGTLLSDMLALQEPYSIDAPAEEEVRAKDHVTLHNDILRPLESWIQLHDGYRVGNTSTNPFAVPLKTLEDQGIVYKEGRSSPGDSQVIFKLGDKDAWRAGRIRQIFKHTRAHQGSRRSIAQTFLAVDEYLPLSAEHAVLDPFRKFPVAGGRLFYNKYEPLPVILTAEDVVCQFAFIRRSFPGIQESVDFAHVLPLDKW